MRRPRYRKIAFLLITALIISTPSCIAANDSTNVLARRILAIELEMQKVNYHLHLEAAIPSLKRARRTWLWDIGNGFATESGLIAATTIFWKHAEDKTALKQKAEFENGRFVLKTEFKQTHNPVHGQTVAASLYPQIVGQAIGGVGALFEVSRDVARIARLRKHLQNGDAVTAKVLALNKDCDSLLNELQAAKPDNDSEVRLLREIKRKILTEFIRIEGQAGNLTAGQFIEDGFSLVRNSVGLIGNSINAYAVIHNNKRLNGQATILNLVAASLITVRPIFSNMGAHIMKKANKERAKKNFADCDFTGSELPYLIATTRTTASSKQQLDRLSLYLQEMEILNEESSITEDESRRLKQIAIRRYRETMYGPTKQSQAILGIIIGFQHGDNATRDNRLAAAGNTTYMTGQALNILELIRERAVDEFAHTRQRYNGLLPEQRLAKQIAAVEKLQRLCTDNVQTETKATE